MYTVYILQSERTGGYYVGMTSDISRRLSEHERGTTRTTRDKGPWKVVHTESCDDRSSAIKREHQIKRYKGGEAFKRLIREHGEVA